MQTLRLGFLNGNIRAAGLVSVSEVVRLDGSERLKLAMGVATRGLVETLGIRTVLLIVDTTEGRVLAHTRRPREVALATG